MGELIDIVPTLHLIEQELQKVEKKRILTRLVAVKFGFWISEPSIGWSLGIVPEDKREELLNYIKNFNGKNYINGRKG